MPFHCRNSTDVAEEKARDSEGEWEAQAEAEAEEKEVVSVALAALRGRSCIGGLSVIADEAYSRGATYTEAITPEAAVVVGATYTTLRLTCR